MTSAPQAFNDHVPVPGRRKTSFGLLLNYWNGKCLSNENNVKSEGIIPTDSRLSTERQTIDTDEENIYPKSEIENAHSIENERNICDTLLKSNIHYRQPKARTIQLWFGISLPVLILMVVLCFGVIYSSKNGIHHSNHIELEENKLRAHPNYAHSEEFVFLKKQISEHVRYFKYGPDISKIGLQSTYPTSLHDAPSVFIKYLKWHALQMRCLRSPDCYREKKGKIRITLWKCPSDSPLRCSGTGDRMRGIISSLAIAMMSKRVFLLEWPDNPYPFIHAVSPAALDWRLPKHMRNDTPAWGIANDKKYPLMEWLQCPESYKCSHRKFEPSGTEYTTVVPRVMNLKDDHTFVYLRRIGNYIIHSVGTYSFNLYRRPEWSTHFSDDAFRAPSTSVLSMNRYLLRALFRPSPFIQSILHSFILPDAKQQGYVAIHARTGEDVGESDRTRFKKIHDVSHVTVAENFLKCAQQKGLKAHQFVYFASDSIVLKSEFNNMAEKHQINVMMSKLPAIHVAHDTEESKHISTADNLLRNRNWISFINIFVEFFAVSNGTSIISNRSEFSRLAHILSNADDLQTFIPSSGQDQCSL